MSDRVPARFDRSIVEGPISRAVCERDAIVDALYRFAAGQDLRDRPLFESAFLLHATVDFAGPARRLGAAIPIFEGRQPIGDAIFSGIGHLDTTHSVTNPRVTTYDGQRASLFALVEAQHLRADHSRDLLLKSTYTLDLSQQGSRWERKS